MGLLAGLLLVVPAAPAAVVEQLHFVATYQGIFSLGQTLPIADVVLRVAAPDGERTLRETELSATSEAHGLVESLYPMRYRFRSWSIGSAPGVVAFENLQKTKRLRHRLYLRDDSESGYRAVDLDAPAGREALRRLGEGADPSAARTRLRLVDRLELLQRVRAGRLDAHTENRYPVTDGRAEMLYRVRVEGAEAVDLGSEAVAAWKVRLDGYERDADGRLVPAHEPLYFWFDQRPGHVPLRIESRHAIGLFRIELDPQRSVPVLAARR